MRAFYIHHLERGELYISSHIAQRSRRSFLLYFLAKPQYLIMVSHQSYTMSLSLLSTALLLGSLLSPASASSNLFPRVISQERDTTYNGGWALGLPSEGCPADAPVNCQDPAKDINPTCCPFGQTCFGFEQPYCCPTSTFLVPHFTSLTSSLLISKLNPTRCWRRVES